MSARSRTARKLAGAGVALGAAAWIADSLIDARRLANGSAAVPLADGEAIEVEAADGTVLHARLFGREGAPTVLLAHAWMCSHELWHGQIEDLADSFRVVAFDHRGHGRSEPARSGDYSIEMIGSDVGTVLDRCVPGDERAVIAGHSTGAMALVAWAHDAREDVCEQIAGAALINTGLGDLIADSTILGGTVRFGARREAIGRSLMASAATIPPRPVLAVRRVVRRVAFGPNADPSHVAALSDLVIACPPRVRAAYGLTLAELDIEHAVASVTAPTVVIAGERDRLTPPSHSRRIAAALPDLVELIELGNVGHMAPIEARAEVSAALRTLAERR